MNKNKLPYEDELYIASDWLVHDRVTFKLLCKDIPSVPSGELLVPASVFEADHPLLPDALRGLIQWSHRAGRDAVDSNNIYHTSRFLHGNCTKLKDVTGAELSFISITDINILQQGLAHILVQGDVFTTNSVAVGDLRVPYVTSLKSINIFMEKADLDRQFPGWDLRYTIGSGLGVDKEELVDYVFNRQPSANTTPDLSDVSFDTQH